MSSRQVQHSVNFKIDYKPYTTEDIDMILEDIKNIEPMKANKKDRNGNKVARYNVPCSFDIEVSSFYLYEGKTIDCITAWEIKKKIGSRFDGIKRATMYIWQFGINGKVIIGRTWEELLLMMGYIKDVLDLSIEKRLVVYVHNLSYEFQFIRNRFSWYNVFAIDDRKPIYAITDDGFEFRCSYLLSGYSLENLGKELLKYKVEKMVGDLDYNLIRNSKTKLNDKELGYCVNDVLVVMAFIQETIEHDKGINNIPYTKTGYVRKLCRKECLYSDNQNQNRKYKRLMKDLILTTDEYLMLKDCFAGGFTHANAFEVNKKKKDVASFDFTSDYPSVIVSQQFPMGRGEEVKIESKSQFITLLKTYCCMFEIKFINIRAKDNMPDNPISVSKCRKISNGHVENNGRLVSATTHNGKDGFIVTTVTEQDFATILEFYDYDDFIIGKFIKYEKDYLPTPLIRAVLKLYKAKTMLKGVPGMEVEYQVAKGMLNSVYGMMVTDICKDVYSYKDNWTCDKADIDDSIKKYNENKGRFLSYPWGVWVTAYARRFLFLAIKECGPDYIYSDTDSVKILNYLMHKAWFDRYNKHIEFEMKYAIQYHGEFTEEDIMPKTIEGKVKLLGAWDYEGTYDYFKTLGAKRYMFFAYDKKAKRKKITTTIAGVNKEKSAEYIENTAKDKKCDPFDLFNDGMFFPKEYTGKLTHTYLDEEFAGNLTDYQGNVASYHELSAIHMEQQESTISIAELFADYLRGIKTIEE